MGFFERIDRAAAECANGLTMSDHDVHSTIEKRARALASKYGISWTHISDASIYILINGEK